MKDITSYNKILVEKLKDTVVKLDTEKSLAVAIEESVKGIKGVKSVYVYTDPFPEDAMLLSTNVVASVKDGSLNDVLIISPTITSRRKIKEEDLHLVIWIADVHCLKVTTWQSSVKRVLRVSKPKDKRRSIQQATA